MHLFGKEPWRHEEFSQLLDLCGLDSDLLLKLPNRPGFWILAGVECAGAYLKEMVSGCMTILAHQGDCVVLKNGDHDSAPFVNDDLSLVFDLAVPDLINAD